MFDKETYRKNREQGKRGVDYNLTIDGYTPNEYTVYLNTTPKAERRGFTTKRERKTQS